MGTIIDLTGMTFGHLTVLKRTDKINNNKSKEAFWLCKCGYCGKEISVRGYSLRTGDSTSCGCTKKPKEDLVGKRFGRLQVVALAGRSKSNENNTSSKLWLCLCDCGKTTKVPTAYLKNGDTKSCGCLLMDVLKDRKYLTDYEVKRNLDALQRKTHLRNKYKITVEEYNEMFEEQGGCCAICGKHQSTMKRALFVDHNHTTGNVRGLLCYKCNTGLGMFEDNKNLIVAAETYLEKEHVKP